jgi:uridine kinase
VARRVHILGASGAGTTTLAQALAARLGCPQYDVDDYFWLPSDPPFPHSGLNLLMALVLPRLLGPFR